MIIKIPIPNTEHAIEFDSDKIDAVGLARGLADQADADKGLELRSKLTLEFPQPEDMPKWVNK